MPAGQNHGEGYPESHTSCQSPADRGREVTASPAAARILINDSAVLRLTGWWGASPATAPRRFSLLPRWLPGLSNACLTLLKTVKASARV